LICLQFLLTLHFDSSGRGIFGFEGIYSFGSKNLFNSQPKLFNFIVEISLLTASEVSQKLSDSVALGV